MEIKYKTIIYAIIFNITLSILTCIILRSHMYSRGIMHFPMGSIGSILLFKSLRVTAENRKARKKTEDS